VNESREHVSSELLQAFLEGELSTERVGEVESHLAACRRCASELDAWRVLFTELEDMPGLGPSEGFAQRVMSQVPTRPSFARRITGRIWSSASAKAGKAGEHLAPERIQDLLDGALRGRGRRTAEAHLHDCAPCRDAVQEWERVFAALGSVPRLEASEGFAERVMAGFQASAARQASAAERATSAVGTDRLAEWAGRAAEIGGRLIPSTGKGWAWMAAALSLPSIGILAVLGAIVAHPLLTLEGLVAFMRWRLSDGIQLGMTWLTERTFQSPIVVWLWDAGAVFVAAPGLALAAFIALWAVTMAAGWVVYRHVIAPSLLADRHV
jgi:anti-sigma factor RsiW